MGMTVEPTTRPSRSGTDVAPPPTAVPAAGGAVPARGWRRWIPRYTWSGTLGAVLFGCASLTPSLLPRGWVLQGLIAGITAAIGYGVGVTVAWFVAELTAGPAVARLPSPGVAGSRRGRAPPLPGHAVVRRGLAAGDPRADGSGASAGYSSAGVVLVAVLVFVLFVAIGRVVRWMARWLIRGLGRVVPRRVARPLGVAVSLSW